MSIFQSFYLIHQHHEPKPKEDGDYTQHSLGEFRFEVDNRERLILRPMAIDMRYA
jgi:hypothetical protein